MLFYVMLTSIVRSILLDCVLFYHAFQVKSTHICFDTYYLSISNCWVRSRVYRKLYTVIGVNVQKSLRTTALGLFSFDQRSPTFLKLRAIYYVQIKSKSYQFDTQHF